VGRSGTATYDAFGDLAAEYSTQAVVSPCGTNTCYLTVDHLGSTRMLTDSNGNTTKLYDYLPFGEELLAGQDGRSSLYASSPDGLGPKFTGQTWDGESSLYWFNVRHMSGAQGRFQGVDPYNAGANLSDPQTWNMYAYVGNNPLSYTDPSGMEGGEVAACAVNPIACGVVIGVELGVTLSHVFGNLGYSGPPVPNWSGTAWGTGPAQAPNYNDGPWSEQNPYGGSGGMNTGGVFGSGNTDPFVFSFEDGTATGRWVTDYKGALVWIEGLPARSTFSSGATLRAAPKRSNLSVAGGCVADALKENILGITLATAASPVPKVLVGDRPISSNYTTLLSKLGRYLDIRGPAVYGRGSQGVSRTTNLLGGAGRILAPAAMALNAAQLLKTGQDASACYSISH
jgi:RHS repeat-associated protein